MRLLFLLLLSLPAFAMERAQGWCERGGTVSVSPASPGGNPQSRSYQQSFPRCQVTVYVTGTATLATIFSNNSNPPTALANPFQADQYGHWYFYGQGRFDVQISGGGLATPYTFGDIKLLDIISVTDFGAQCDGSTDDTTALTSAFAATNGKSLYVPAGTCIISNTSPFTVTGWSGRLWGDTGSTFSCSNLLVNCFVFNTASNLTIENITFTYTSTRTTRVGGQLFVVVASSNVILNGIAAHNGNLAGVLLQQDTNVQVSNMRVYDMLANGLFITNSSSVTVSGLYCNNVQDYCMEASQYDPFAGVPSGTCQYVNVSNMVSVNTFAGALFNGCPDSSISNFSVYNSYSGGVVVLQDSTTTLTAWPYRVSISNGSISNSGFYPQVNPLACGIQVQFDNAPPRAVDVSISNVNMYNIQADGIRIGKDQAGDVSLADVSMTGILVDTSNVGYRFAMGRNLTFAGIQTKNSGRYGVYIPGTSGTAFNVSGSNLYIYNANSLNVDNRAMYSTNTGDLLISGLTLVDDRNPAQGYVITDSSVGAVQVSDIVTVIPHGTSSIASATGRYLMFSFYQYKAISLNVDATGTDCQIVAAGFTITGEQLKLCYDTIADFGWIQATHQGVGNKTLKLNPNGGSLFFGQCKFTVGTGSPNGSVTGSICDMYMNNAGGSGTTFYVKESGTNTNTGWVGK